MKKALILFALSGLCALAAAQEEEKPGHGLDEVRLEYTILPPEMGESDLRAHGDTISFTIFYVDDDCGDDFEYVYEYVWKKKKRELILKRALLPGGECSSEDQYLYGVKGMLVGVPKGIYAFTLNVQNAKRLETIFSEPIEVK